MSSLDSIQAALVGANPSLNEQERTKFDERRDVFELIKYIELPWPENWLRCWGHKVLAMDDSCIGRLRTIGLWLEMLTRNLPFLPSTTRDHVKMKERFFTTIMKSLETGSLTPIRQRPWLDIPSPANLAEFKKGRDIQKLYSLYSSDILFSYAGLHDIWREREEQIKDTWKNLATEERERLLNTWEGINLRHREDFLGILQHGADQKVSLAVARARDPPTPLQDGKLSWPNISIEDLQRGDVLLKFIEARATMEPFYYVWEDAQSVAPGLAMQWMEKLPAEYVMAFPQIMNPRNYGEMVNIHLLAEKCSTLNQEVFGGNTPIEFRGNLERLLFGKDAEEGVSMMKSQAHVYLFLHHMCHSIVDYEPLGLLSESEGEQSQNNEDEDLDPLVRLLMEHEYSRPGSADMNAMLDLISAKIREREDTIMSMRTDPAFFETLLGQTEDLHPEKVWVSGKGHNKMNSDAHERLLRESIRPMFFRVLGDYTAWSEIHSRFLDVRNIMEIYSEQLKNSKGRPEELIPTSVRDRCRELIGILEYQMIQGLESFAQDLAACPLYRHAFTRSKSKNNVTGRFDIHLRATTWGDKKTLDTLLLIAHHLLGDKETSTETHALKRLWGLTIKEIIWYFKIMEERTEKKMAAKISPLLRGRLSYLSVLGACWVQIYQFQPWATNFDFRLADGPGGPGGEEIDHAKEKIAAIERSLEQVPLEAIAGDFGFGGLAKLFDGEPTEANTQERQKAEAELEKIWNAVDQSLKKTDILTSLREILDREKDRTPNWPTLSPRTSPTAGPSSQIAPTGTGKSRPGKRPSDEAHLDDVSDDELEPPGKGKGKEKEKERRKGKATDEPRKKVKTRPEHPPKAYQAPQKPEEPEEKPTRQFSMPKRDISTLKYLFFERGVRVARGGVDWTDFKHAMGSLGFRLTSLTGSAHALKPPKEWRMKTIIVHSPHPSTSLSFREARDVGKRLTNNYGLTAKSFIARGL